MRRAGSSRLLGTALAGAVAFLAAGGGQAVCAATSGEARKDCPASVVSSPAPAAVALEATLTGTVLVEGGRSLALFEPSGGVGLIREGEAFADGSYLCEVQADRIVVGRGGGRREVFLGSRGQPAVAAPPRSAGPATPGAAAVGPVVAAGGAPPAVVNAARGEANPTRASLLESRAANFRAMLERRQPQPSVQ